MIQSQLYLCTHCYKPYCDHVPLLCFSTNNLLKNPQKLMKTFKCSLCSKFYMSNSSLIRHRREIHDLQSTRQKRVIECTECGNTYGTTRGWKDHHEQWHSTPKMFTCTWCDRIYLSKTRARLHQREAHNGEAEMKDTNAEYKVLPVKEWTRPFESTTKQMRINVVPKEVSEPPKKIYKGYTDKEGRQVTIQ